MPIRKSMQLPAYIDAALEHWQRETGWVGIVMLGGIDAAGEIGAYT